MIFLSVPVHSLNMCNVPVICLYQLPSHIFADLLWSKIILDKVYVNIRKALNLVSASGFGSFHQKGCVLYLYIVKESIPTVWMVFLISMIKSVFFNANLRILMQHLNIVCSGRRQRAEIKNHHKYHISALSSPQYLFYFCMPSLLVPSNFITRTVN